jgi:hypothetical protein
MMAYDNIRDFHGGGDAYCGLWVITPYSLVGRYQRLERVTSIFKVGERAYAPGW